MLSVTDDGRHLSILCETTLLNTIVQGAPEGVFDVADEEWNVLQVSAGGDVEDTLVANLATPLASGSCNHRLCGSSAFN
jgi:hypothetical protein